MAPATTPAAMDGYKPTNRAGHKFPALASLVNRHVLNLSHCPFVPLRIQYDTLIHTTTNTIKGKKILHRKYLRGASWSLDSVRTASNSKKKPPTTSSDGHESRRWREGTVAPRDAGIVRVAPHNGKFHDSIQYGRTHTRSDRRQEPTRDDLGDAVEPGKVLEGHVRRAVAVIIPRVVPDDASRTSRHEGHADDAADAGMGRGDGQLEVRR